MKIEDLISKLPPMNTGAELTKALEDIPPYSEDVRNADTTTRLMALSELYNIYIPSSMSHEIYSKLYLAMIRFTTAIKIALQPKRFTATLHNMIHMKKSLSILTSLQILTLTIA